MDLHNTDVFKRKVSQLSFFVFLGLFIDPVFAGSGAFISAPEADVETQITKSNDPTVTREKIVTINSGLIKPSTGLNAEAADDSTASDAPQTASSLFIELDFFEDPMLLVLDSSTLVGKNITSWVGHVQGVPDSQAVLVVGERGIVQGNITSGYKKYHIRYAEHVDDQPVHVLQEIDMSKFTPDHPPGDNIRVIPQDAIDNVTGSQSDGSISPSTANDGQLNPVAESDTAVVGSGAMINVMVLYTATAAGPVSGGGVGSASAMDTLIALAITETNAGYAASGIAQRMNLVHSQQVTYAETGSMSDALYDVSNINLPSNSPPLVAANPITIAPSLRDTHKADLVGLILSHSDNWGGCGLGWVGPSNTNTLLGYQVTAQNCATGNYSFAHEFGHNQGALHDRRIAGLSGDGKYQYGYVKADKSWRTVMAYNDSTNCAELPSPPYNPGIKHCFRRNFWSNPNKSYNGDATGIDSSNAVGADNAKWLNEKAYQVSNNRDNNDTYILPANEWHQIGLPYAAPSGQSTVADVIGDDMTGTINVDWALFKYDSAAGVYVPLTATDAMEQGVGYWIKNVNAQVTLDMPTGFEETPTLITGVKCPSSSGCFETPPLITRAGTHTWNMMSNPFPQNKQVKGLVIDSTHAICQATNGCTFDSAVTNTQVNGTMYHYNNTIGDYDVITSDSYLSPWAGFWLATLQGADGTSPKLLIPSNVQRP